MNFPITECPHCGNDEIYLKVRYSGESDYNMKLDGSLGADNSMLFNTAWMKPKSRYAYCNNCDKKLFKISDDIYSL